jgi:hypothetical protein
MLMSAALVGTTFADFSTQAKDFRYKWTLAGHCLNGERTNIRAFPVKPDALPQ